MRLEPLHRRPFRRMVMAQFSAELGDGIAMVALPLYVWERTESGVWTSLTFAVELGLGVVLALLGGVLADAFDRQRVLLISYFIRALLLVLAFTADPLLLAVGLGVSARALGMADNPSFDALVPGQAKNDLQEVLAIRRIVQAASITIGPAIGALAVTQIGARPALLLNAAAFVVALLVLGGIRGLDADFVARRAKLDELTVAQASRDLFAGMAVAATTPGVRRLLLHMCVVMTTIGLLMASALVYFSRDLDVGEYWFGLCIGAYGIGSATGLALAANHKFTWPLPRIIGTATPMYAVACAIGVAVEMPLIVALSWFVWGILLGPETVNSETFFVGRIAEEERGRAFAGLGVASALGMAGGSLAAAPLLAAFSARWVILGTGGAVLLAGAIWIGPALEGHDWPDRGTSITADSARPTSSDRPGEPTRQPSES